MMIEATYTLIAGAAMFGSCTPVEFWGKALHGQPAHPAPAALCSYLSQAWFLITHRHLCPSYNEKRTRPLAETGGGTPGEGAQIMVEGRRVPCEVLLLNYTPR